MSVAITIDLPETVFSAIRKSPSEFAINRVRRCGLRATPFCCGGMLGTMLKNTFKTGIGLMAYHGLKEESTNMPGA